MNNQQVMTQENCPIKNVRQKKPFFRLTPAVDIYETNDELVLMADLPDVEKSGLQLEISRGVLTLEAEIKSAEKEKQHCYYQQFALSERINADIANAALKDGVLALRLAKSETAKPKRIVVKTLH